MDMGLKDKVVMVTGSSSGIGRATAIAFGREGAKTVLTYHSNRDKAEEAAQRVREAGGEALTVPYDLTDDRSIRDAVATVTGHWGSVHVLINNAVQWANRGGPSGAPLFEEVPVEQWRGMIRSSLEGVYITIQQVVGLMRDQQWGRIVNISSDLAEDGLPGAGSYAAGKAGLHGLTRTLCKELGVAGIFTNVVLPGMTLTERAKDVLPRKVIDQVAGQTPTGRLTTPEEVASLVVYLGSAANGHVNGERVRVTGGH